MSKKNREISIIRTRSVFNSLLWMENSRLAVHSLGFYDQNLFKNKDQLSNLFLQIKKRSVFTLWLALCSNTIIFSTEYKHNINQWQR